MKFALIVLFAGTTLAAPFWVLDDTLPSASIKELGCKTNRFGRGNTHTYEYEGETLNTIEGSTKRTTGIKMTATVVISSLSECKYRMDLMNVNVFTKGINQDDFQPTSGSTEAKLREDLERNTVGFAMSGDQIISIISGEGETAQILNIKRGILSTIQLDNKSAEETDIHGKCWTEVTSVDGKVIKSKKLSECTKRAQNEIAFQTSSFKRETEMKPLDSTSDCEYVFENGQIKSVLCKETHIFKPFSAGYETPSGAMTTVRQTLRRTKNKGGRLVAMSGKDFVKTSTLSFDHESNDVSATKDVNHQFETVMTRLANPTSEELSARQDSAHEFSNLVFLLRKMDSKRMEKNFEEYFNCTESGICGKNDFALRDLYRQYLLDGLAYCGTPTCISVVREVILKSSVAGERMDTFLQSITFIGKPTENIIRDILTIAKEKPSRQAFLTLGTLMFRLCSNTEGLCNKKRGAIAEAEEFLHGILRNECNNGIKQDKVETILMALKAIGNAQRPTNAQETMLKCARKSQHAHITSSIFDAFRGMPCDKLIINDLFKHLENVNENDESRMHAFMTIMQCPSEEVLRRINDTLTNEESKHLTSFMWSHLTNIMESTDPSHAMSKDILSKIMPIREVNLPFYKFSKSFEKSLYSNSNGATTRGHIIYNKDNFIPKMGMLNVKGHFLGQPINMLETKVGIDGIESLMEELAATHTMVPKDINIDLGRYGKLTSEMIQDWIKTKSGNLNTNENLSRMHMNRKNTKTPFDAHMTMKIMGQEMKVFTYSDIVKMIDDIDNLNVVKLLKNVAKGGHKVFSKGIMFLEMTHTVPTGLGLPLKLKLTGSSVSTVELKGKFDIRNLFWGSRPSVDIDGFMRPSAVVELSGQMGIESSFISTGMFVNSSMFTSQIVKGKIQYKHNKMLRINIDTPDEPLQHVNFSSTPFMYMNEEAELIEGTPRKINPDYCMKSKIIGYGICYNMRLPMAFREYEAPYFPLSGPAYMGIKLVKGDDKMKTFQFLVEMEKSKNTNEVTTVGNIEFSTPGAEYERRVTGKMVFTEKDDERSLTLSTKKFGKKGSIAFIYNTVSYSTEITTRNNFFTPKEVVTTMKFFNNQNKETKEIGLSQMVSYDWYTFQHESKVTIEKKGYRFTTETTYYPEKTVSAFLDYNLWERKLTGNVNLDGVDQTLEFTNTFVENGNENGLTLTARHVQTNKKMEFYGGIVNTEARKLLVLTADVFGKKAKNIFEVNFDENIIKASNDLSLNGKLVRFSGDLTTSEGQQHVKLSADIMGKKATSSIIVTNKEQERSFRLIVTTTKKVADIKVGYYKKAEMHEVRLDGKVLENSFEVFTKMSSASGYKTTFGGSFNKYFGGIRGNYVETKSDKKSLCSSIYYGKDGSEQEPVIVCVDLESLSQSYLHNRLTFSMEMINTGKKGEFYFDFRRQTGKVVFVNGLGVNGKDLYTNTYSLKYTSDMNNELRMDVIVGKFKTGYSLVTVKTIDGGKLGFEAYYMDKKVALIHTLTEKKSMRTVISQVLLNDVVLPVSTESSVIHGDGVTNPMFKIIVGKYSFLSSLRTTYTKPFYEINSEVSISKQENVLFKTYTESSLKLSEKNVMLKQKYGFVINGKTYVYGWDAAYENRGSETKMARAVILGLRYSTTRRSSMTFLLSSTKKKTALNVDVEYIPGKQVSHYISVNRADRQVDISVEFLPKMFFTLMTKLNNDKGYSLNTDVKLNWKNYERKLTMLNSYVNNNRKFEVSTSFGKDISVSLKYFKNSPKTILLSAEAFNRNAKISVILSSPQISFILNNKVVFRTYVNYNAKTGNMKFGLSNGKNTFFSVKKAFNTFTRKSSFKVLGKDEWFSVSFGRKDMSFSVFGRKYFGIKNIIKNNKIVLTLDSSFYKNELKIGGSVNEDEKSISLFSILGKNKCGFTWRFDWNRMIAGQYAFCNRKTVGVVVFAGQHSLNAKILLPNKMEFLMIMEVQDDRMLKMTFQRTVDGKTINESSFSYKLSKNMCQFAFNWNHDNIKSLKEAVYPVIQKYISKTQRVSNNFKDQSTKTLEAVTKEIKERVFYTVNNMDKAFDEIDFNDAAEKVNSLFVSASKNTRKAIKKSIRMLLKVLEDIRKNIPKAAQQLIDMRINGGKLFTDVIEKLSNRKSDIKTILLEVTALLQKVSTNLTESSKPVMKTAIKLLKEFKVRGKTLNQHMEVLKKLVKKYWAIIEKESKQRFVDMKIIGQEMFQEYKEKLMKMKIPYNEKTVEEIVRLTVEKIMELKGRASDVDINKVLEDVKTKTLSYKVFGKTLPDHIKTLERVMQDAPENTKENLKDLVKNIRKYHKETRKTIKAVEKFAEPLTEYLKIVIKSFNKHILPLAQELYQEVIGTVPDFKIPEVTKFFKSKMELYSKLVRPFTVPISDLAKDYSQQLRNIKVKGFKVGTLLDMNVDIATEMTEKYIKKMSKCVDKCLVKTETMLKKFTNMSPEEIIDMVFDETKQMSKEIKSYISKVISERKERLTHIKSAFYDNVISKLERQLDILQKMSFEKTFDETIMKISTAAVSSIEELSNVIEQIAELSIWKPSVKAWEEMNLEGLMKKYGLQRNIEKLIKSLKEVNITKSALKVTKRVKATYYFLYGEAFLRVVRVINNVEKVMDYVKSIPKKDYEDWANEVKSILNKWKDEVVSSSAAYPKYLQTKGTQYYDTVSQLAEKSYNQVKNIDFEPVKKVFNRVAEKSTHFYNDIEEPSISVYKHYKAIAKDFTDEKYKIIEAELTKMYEKIEKEFNSKMKELKSTLVKKYNTFLDKYGDMTWEEIMDESSNFVEIQTRKTTNYLKKVYKKTDKKFGKLVAKAIRQYEKILRKYNKYVKYLQEDVKPKAIELFNKYYGETYTTLENYYSKIISQIEKLQDYAMSTYENNKDKTIKKLYRDIKVNTDIFVKVYSDMLYKQGKARMEVVRKNVMKYYRKSTVLLTNVILPEVAAEMESLINQTLKASVIFGKEVVKAYTPQVRMVTKQLQAVSWVAFERSLEIVGKSKVELRKQLNRLTVVLKDLKKDLESNEMVAKLMNNKNVRNMKVKIQKWIKVMLEKIEQLKKHPQFTKLSNEVMKVTEELQEKFVTYKTMLNNYYEKEEVQNLIKTLLQIKKSTLFTANKLNDRYGKVIQNLVENVVEGITIIPEISLKSFEEFCNAPEEFFWKNVKMAKEGSLGFTTWMLSFEKEKLETYYLFVRQALRKEFREIRQECFDKWTKETTKQLKKDLMTTRRQLERKIKKFPALAKQFASKYYKKSYSTLKVWYKETKVQIFTAWKKCPYRMIFKNKVWGEIADEVQNHELVELAKDGAEFSKVHLMKWTSKGKKQIKVFMKKWDKMLKQMGEMKDDFEQNMRIWERKMKTKIQTLKTKAVELFNDADKFLETTTIGDLVEMSRNKYNDVVEYTRDMKVKALAMKAKQTEKAMEMYKVYKNKLERIYKRYYGKTYEKLMELRAKYMPMIKQMQARLNQLINRLKVKTMKIWNKNYPYYQTQYTKMRDSTIDMAQSYKTKTVEVAKKMKKESLRRWMESDIRSSLMSLKKITIRETIEAIKKLPKKTKTFVVVTYKKYHKMATSELENRYKQMIDEYIMRREQLVRFTEPYITPVIAVYEWTRNEITETLVFVYKYHHVEKRYNTARKYVKSEIERLTPIAKERMNKMMTNAKQMTNMYIKDAKVYAHDYKNKVIDFTKKTSQQVGDNTLRSIHTSLKYIDNFDMEKVKRNARSIYSTFTQYVTIDAKTGEILITIPHRDVVPSFSHHFNKVGHQVKRTVRMVQNRGKEMMDEIQTKLEEIQKKVEILKEKVQRQVMENTRELRTDLETSYKVNKAVFDRVYSKLHVTYRKYMKKASIKYAQLMKQYYKMFIEMKSMAYVKANEIFTDLYATPIAQLPKKVAGYSNKWYKIAERKTTELYKTYKPVMKKFLKTQSIEMRQTIKKYNKLMSPYKFMITDAFKKIKGGKPVTVVAAQVYEQLKFLTGMHRRRLMRVMETERRRICKTDPKLCKYVRNSVKTHSFFMNKYMTKINGFTSKYMDKFNEMQVKMYRYARYALYKCWYKSSTKYRDVAMIFGDSHILTFDKVLYNLPQTKSSECKHVLLNDFKNREMTVVKGNNYIEVATPKMKVKLFNNGKAVTVLADKTVQKGLPLATESGKCRRVFDFIFCNFYEQKMKMKMNLKDKVTTISVSGWHHGKIQGLFGTNNLEKYDDLTLPNGKLSTSIPTFINSYELTGSSKCRVGSQQKPTCVSKEMPRCEDVFGSKTSPYAKYFGVLETEAFMKACLEDYQSCKRIDEPRFCSAVTAFVTYARSSGYKISKPDECMTYNSRIIGSEWTQKVISKKVDVVVMVSQRTTMDSLKFPIAKALAQVQTYFKQTGLDARYALIGFGGKILPEKAHVHALSKDGEIFSNMNDLERHLTNMDFHNSNDDSNDAYQAILLASHQTFRPSSNRIFILFNTEPHNAHTYGPTELETVYSLTKEADASLFVFDNFSFKRLQRQGKTYGQTKKFVFTTRNIKGLEAGRIEFPIGPMKELVEKTNGGMFTNNISKPKDTANMLYKAIKESLKMDRGSCRRCTVEKTWYGQAKPLCKPLPRNEC